MRFWKPRSNPMKKGLTYPAQRCVLQYLEANRRLLLSARCPSIKAIDKKIPFQIRYLAFEDNTIHLNAISYKFQSVLSRMQEAFARNLFYVEYVKMSFAWERSGIPIRGSRRLPANCRHVDIAFENFIGILLEGRFQAQIRTLDFYKGYEQFLRIPENLKFHTQNINIYRFDAEEAEKIMDEKCLPLKSVRVQKWEPYYSRVALISKAEKLALVSPPHNRSQRFWHPILLSATNKIVELRYLELSGTRIREIVRKLKENGKEIGSYYILECSGRMFLNRLLEKIKQRFDGKEVTMNEETGTTKIVSRIISVPLNPESELVVYGYTDYEENKSHLSSKNKVRIHLKVLAVGSTTQVEKKKKKRIRIPCIF